MFSAILTKIFGSKNERDLKQIYPIVAANQRSGTGDGAPFRCRAG